MKILDFTPLTSIVPKLHLKNRSISPFFEENICYYLVYDYMYLTA